MPDPVSPPACTDRGQVRVQAQVLEVRRYPNGLFALIRLAVVNPASGATICAQESTLKIGHPGEGQVCTFDPIPLYLLDFVETPDALTEEIEVAPGKQPDPGF